MTLYKLTRQDGTTYGGCQWGEGVEHTASGAGDLCGPGWLHAYTHPLLAVLLNPVHAAFADPILWEADGDVGKVDNGLKVGCTRLKTIRKISLPSVTTEQRVRFAILCAKRVYDGRPWVDWANNWLSGKDRSPAAEAARSAARAARAAEAWAAEAARSARAEAAAWAAWAAARAARAAAAWAAEAAAEAWAAEAWAAARAARAAEAWAAEAARSAARAAAERFNLAAVAEEACR